MQKQFTKVGDGLLVRAPGKINLSLLVKGKRPDGYHDIESIMAKIDLYDEILIERQTEDGTKNIEHRTQNAKCRIKNIELICKGPYEVPAGEDNLVYKAARAMLEDRGQAALRITLTKNMPAGSGLGSGSSDAAATLMGINKFFKLGQNKKQLMSLAAKLGSDVSFFLNGPIALCTGRGEKIEKILKSEFRVLLILPDISVSTKRVYENYNHKQTEFDRLHNQIRRHIQKKRVDLVCKLCANMLQESCYEEYPRLGKLKKEVESLGIGPVGLSGSGSSLFCFINSRNEEKVMAYRDKLAREYGCRSVIVTNNSW